MRRCSGTRPLGSWRIAAGCLTGRGRTSGRPMDRSFGRRVTRRWTLPMRLGVVRAEIRHQFMILRSRINPLPERISFAEAFDSTHREEGAPPQCQQLVGVTVGLGFA